MEMSLYKKTEQFVIDAFTKAEKPTDIYHAQRTAYWIKELKPDADEALLIAGLAHDIERAFYGDWKKGMDDPEALEKHSRLSGGEIGKFLQKENAPAELIAKVKELILHHEEGGNDEQNVLCDADALAFFEEKVLRRVKNLKKEGVDKEEIKRRIDYYFSRLKSEKAKQIAQPFYEVAVEEIDKK